MEFLKNPKLEKDFYTRELLTVAKELLGKLFVKINDGKILAGKIVEVEAYHGSFDEAAHTFIGKTPRNQIMFEEGGFLYVYFTYGMYFCCNVVAGKKDEGAAVLLRAVEPVYNSEIMAENRYGKTEISKKEFHNLTSGPGKLCIAYDITRKDNGTNLLENNIFILDNTKIPQREIVTTTRIGIKKSVDLPWRFYIKNNPFISKK